MKKIINLIVIGSNSFIASSFISKIDKKKFNLIKLHKPEFDLFNIAKITKIFKKYKDSQNIIFFAAAIAPCKSYTDLYLNIKMVNNFIENFNSNNISHFYYLSSDAVFSDSKKRINEKFKKEPNNLHGLMHLIRENIIKSKFNHRMSAIRPTLVYGFGDKHNGYGPNKFISSLKKGEDIYLFGKGEEIRDHIYINDIGTLISLIINNGIKDDLNLVTGNDQSFLNIATIIHKNFNNNHNKIIFSKRVQPMPHNGYRVFDNSKIFKFFPKFKFTKFNKSIKDYISQIS